MPFTPTEQCLLTDIHNLQSLLISATLEESGVASIEDIMNKKIKKLVDDRYFAKKKRNSFYTCSDGRIKSYNPQFIANSEEELYKKLYEYYFGKKSFEDLFFEWVHYRRETETVTPKTIEEDLGIWRRFLEGSDIAHMKIDEIRPKHLQELFDVWTGNGKITRKDFNNRKSVLNGVFSYACCQELITSNPVSAIRTSSLKFKFKEKKVKAYTVEERKKLLSYIETLPQDAYTLAIQLALYGVFRIGEIKGITWQPSDENLVHIHQQIVEERIIDENLTFRSPECTIKQPKGNPYYSIRTQIVSPKAVEVLQQMRKINPNGDLLFLNNGSPLTTSTFNRRLKKYCSECGIEYLSSHKIRFTDASILYDRGMDTKEIQKMLGHSSLAMTLKYLEQHVTDRDPNEMSSILS